MKKSTQFEEFMAQNSRFLFMKIGLNILNDIPT